MKKELLIILMTLCFEVANVQAQSDHHFALYDYSLDSNLKQINLSALTADGGMIVLTGNEYRGTISPGDYGFSLIRYDASGNKLWNNFIYGETSFQVNYKRIVELPDLGFAIVGNTAILGGGFVLKTNSSGDFVFMKNFGYEIFDCIVDPSDNGFLITENLGNTISRIVKTDAAGTTLWSDARNFLPDPDHYYTARRLNNGNYLAVGVAYNNPSLVTGSGLITCYSSTGAIVWTQGYVGPELVTSFKNFTELADGTILLAGIGSTTNVSGSRTMITKIDSTGNVLWCKSSGMGVPINNFGFTFAGNYIYISGNYEYSGSTVRPVILKMDTAAQVLFTHVFPELVWPIDFAYGSSNDFSILNGKIGFNNYKTFCMTDTALTQACALYDTTFSMASVTMTTVISTPTTGTAAFVPTDLLRTNSSNVNFTKVDACLILGIESAYAENVFDVSVYPNPANGSFNVHVSNAEQLNSVCFQLINSLGETIKQFNVSSENNKVELNNIPSGIYFYILNDQQNILKSGKIILE
ncbi:MAG: T9SS type A sorting domain-containing protein [Bacteroidota bacterium]